jgi:hypothetical protein
MLTDVTVPASWFLALVRIVPSSRLEADATRAALTTSFFMSIQR